MDSRTSIVPHLEAGLKAAQLRAQAIANNVANMNTPGYRRVDVEFQECLADALASGDPSAAEPRLVRPETTEVRDNGNDVDLDMEVGAMIQNSALYKTYMRVLAKHYQHMDMAMRQQL